MAAVEPAIRMFGGARCWHYTMKRATRTVLFTGTAKSQEAPPPPWELLGGVNWWTGAGC